MLNFWYISNQTETLVIFFKNNRIDDDRNETNPAITNYLKHVCSVIFLLDIMSAHLISEKNVSGIDGADVKPPTGIKRPAEDDPSAAEVAQPKAESLDDESSQPPPAKKKSLEQHGHPGSHIN